MYFLRQKPFVFVEGFFGWRSNNPNVGVDKDQFEFLLITAGRSRSRRPFLLIMSRFLATSRPSKQWSRAPITQQIDKVHRKYTIHRSH